MTTIYHIKKSGDFKDGAALCYCGSIMKSDAKFFDGEWLGKDHPENPWKLIKREQVCKKCSRLYKKDIKP